MEPFKRVNFFDGQLLTREDLQQEQDYHRGKRRLTNSNLFGAGVVCGLEVEEADDDVVVVKPGYALDCCGNDLLLSCEVELDRSTFEEGAQIIVEYEEVLTDPRPSAAEKVPSRVLESARIHIGQSPLLTTHEETESGWKACGKCTSVPIAVIRDGKVVPLSGESQNESPRDCPVCGAQLTPTKVKSVVVDACEEHGMWLDHGELKRILEKQRRSSSSRRKLDVRRAREQGKAAGALFGWMSLLD